MINKSETGDAELSWSEEIRNLLVLISILEGPYEAGPSGKPYSLLSIQDVIELSPNRLSELLRLSRLFGAFRKR